MYIDIASNIHMFICAGSSGTIDERTAYTERTRDLSMGRGNDGAISPRSRARNTKIAQSC